MLVLTLVLTVVLMLVLTVVLMLVLTVVLTVVQCVNRVYSCTTSVLSVYATIRSYHTSPLSHIIRHHNI